jgi:hypothetical protein
MSTIARIIVTESEFKNKRQLFIDFIAESKKLLLKGEKHQFILLPAGFLTFSRSSFITHFPHAEQFTHRATPLNFKDVTRLPILPKTQFLCYETTSSNDLTDIPLSEPQEKSAKQKWKAKIEVLQEQALMEFHRSLDAEVLTELKSIAKYLVIGIDSHADPDSQDIRIQFVLVYDLQSGKPLHWTGKTYPQKKEMDCLIKMPIGTHFIKEKIDGKKVAVFGCHDLSIFNPRHQHHFSPFDDERQNVKRKEHTSVGQIKCPFIDATLDFCPDIMLQLPHTEGTWAAKWTKLNEWLRRKKGKELQHFATGLKRSPKKQYPLSGTQRGDVVNFAHGKWIETNQQ